MNATDHPELEVMRIAFEKEAREYGFNVTRQECPCVELWCEYSDINTGHRWAGYVAGFVEGAFPF